MAGRVPGVRWSSLIAEPPLPALEPGRPGLLGVLRGEGIGPEVVGAALNVLSAIESVSDHRFEVLESGPIGLESRRATGQDLSDEVVRFCERVFAEDGAVLAGPGGGRFVYDLRRRFDLFCKVCPLIAFEELIEEGPLRASHVRDVDVLVLRENASGIYHGEWSQEESEEGERVARHAFSYRERDVRRLIEVGARAAAFRRGVLAVAVKDHGLPTISALWREIAAEVARDRGISWTAVDVDYAAYRIVHDPASMDVVVASNLFGDVLSDVGGLLVGSRGLGYSASFSASGAAVYQTNHGAAKDIAGTDRANPAGQILSLAMLLGESFGLRREADRVIAALRDVWRHGHRTVDQSPDAPLGTRAMADLVAEAVLTRGAIAGPGA